MRVLGPGGAFLCKVFQGGTERESGWRVAAEAARMGGGAVCAVNRLQAARDAGLRDVAEAAIVLATGFRPEGELSLEGAPKQATAAACSTAVPMTRQCASRPSPSLDDVDLCREVAGDLEADFLLANGRLGPISSFFCFLLILLE